MQLRDSVVIVSMQNGVENARLLQNYMPDHVVIACVVGFNVVWQAPATFHRGTTKEAALL